MSIENPERVPDMIVGGGATGSWRGARATFPKEPSGELIAVLDRTLPDVGLHPSLGPS